MRYWLHRRAWLLSAAAASALILVTGSAPAAAAVVQLRSFGGLGTGAGKLHDPIVSAVGAGGPVM